jgi:hypothetical protein
MGEEIKSEKTEKKQDKRKLNPNLFKPGQSGNPNGRPKGALNFATKWMNFIEKVAEQNEKTPNEIDEEMLRVVYNKIIEGDHRFWKDIMDRVHGQAKQTIEHEDIGEREQKVPTEAEKKAAEAFRKVLNNERSKKN